MHQIVVLLSAFGICVLLHILAFRFFPRLGLLDFPERYGLKRPRLPYPTGIIALLVFFVFFVLLFPFNFQNIGLLAAVFLLGMTSFIDDRTPLPAALRLGIQILASLLIFATGTRIYTITNPLDQLTLIPFVKLDAWTVSIPPFGLLPVWSGIFTVLWLGFTINALNWFDGIPGQVSTLSTIGFLTIGFLSLSGRVDQPELALLAFLLAGISAGCLFFDFPPPKVLMGDTGAMFFGLMLGVLTIYAGGKIATSFLVLGVPLIDLLFVSIRRFLGGRPVFRGSLRGDHLHHRLLAKGWSLRQVIALTATLGGVFGVSALFLNTFEKFLAAMFLLVLMAALSLYSEQKPIS